MKRIYTDHTASDMFVVAIGKEDVHETSKPTHKGIVGDEFWQTNLSFSADFVQGSLPGEDYTCWSNSNAMDMDMIAGRHTMTFRVKKSHPDAVVPTKAHMSDAGFDVTAIRVLKTEGDVTFYGTGIHVQPPFGYYFQLVPRSSISKTGFSLANSVGIIDAGYQGEIIIALRNNDPYRIDLPLPCRIAQLIPVEIHPMRPVVVDRFLGETERGEGGFGSSNK